MKTKIVAAPVTVAPGGVPSKREESVRLAFLAGATGTVIESPVTGHAGVDNLLRVAAGQTMQARLESAATAHFNVLVPGQDDPAFYVRLVVGHGAAEATVESGGDDALRLYLMGADRDAGRMVPIALIMEVR